MPSWDHALRQRAEEIAQAKADELPALLADLSQAEAKHALQELMIHQIELEMQNEELRRTQMELEVSRARYFDLYNLAPVGYFTLNQHGLILEANLTASTLLGVPRSNLVKQPLSRYIVPADQNIFYQHQRSLVSVGAPQSFQLRIMRADEHSFWVQMESAAASQDADGTLTYRTVISDINTVKLAQAALKKSHTELEQTLDELQATQMQLIQQEKLASIGQLAAGVAHDFNNILAVITLQVEMGQHMPNLPIGLPKRFEAIAQQTKRAAHLVQQILDFARRAVLEHRLLDLAVFCQEVVEMLLQVMPTHITLTLDYAPGEYFISADPTRIQQMLTNLAINAQDAMPDGGELAISLDHLVLQKGSKPPLPGMDAARWIQMTVRDTGTGITPEVLAHLFEPFFTTKEGNEGTGLGLAQVYGIVKQLNGHIDVQTKVGDGTTFILYLPAIIVPPSVILPTENGSIPSGQGQTILVVEDNETLRESIVEMIELLNYRAHAVAHGRAALEVLAQQAGEIDLVLSDLMMPEMNGRMLLQGMRTLGITLPLVMMSGYPLEDDLVELSVQGLSGWLLKPLNLAQLATVLANALPQESQAAH